MEQRAIAMNGARSYEWGSCPYYCRSKDATNGANVKHRSAWDPQTARRLSRNETSPQIHRLTPLLLVFSFVVGHLRLRVAEKRVSTRYEQQFQYFNGGFQGGVATA